jgi:hypothetical protein
MCGRKFSSRHRLVFVSEHSRGENFDDYRNRKIINIDDILLDDYKENIRKLKNKTANTRKNAKLKTNKSHLYESSDEDVDGSNAPEVVKDLEEQVWKGFGFRVRHLALVPVAMEIVLGMSEVCLSSRVCH